ncbi:MAG: hypothetical protein ACE5DO_08170, partial [Desulfobacterales bacterium]
AASINEKQANQRHRVKQGVVSGELTAREANRLARRQAQIARKERRFKSDGIFTKRERAIIHKDLAEASQNIYRQKHDDQSR